MLTLKAALEEATASIGRVDAQAIFTHLLGVNRAYLVANSMRVLTESEDARMDSLVALRQMGRPIAHLLGAREFYSRDFAVNGDVLIPRPETETLVEAALSHSGASSLSRAGGNPARVLDLGTGSGAIAITLACERPGLTVTATDASAAALDVARANAKTHGAAIEFLQGDWYAPVAGRRFELIVANPPYIAAHDQHLEQGDLRFEPRPALTDESPDGLGSIRIIVAGAAQHLNPGGSILIEHGYDQAPAVARLFQAAGLGSFESLADLAGIPRVAVGRLPG